MLLFLQILIYFFIWLLGAAIASFLGVLYYRLPKKIDWVKTRSKCEKCSHQLFWYENIPVFSYIFLRGKCSQCGKKISAFYFWWELLGGFFFLWLVYFSKIHFLNFWQTILLFLFGESLVLVTLVDWQKRYITNKWLKRLFVLSVIFLVFNFFIANFSWLIIGERILMALIWGGFFWVIDFLAKKILHVTVARGSGDAFFVLILSLWLLPRQSLTMILAAFWTGALMGMLLLLRKKITHQGDGKIAFIPFLVWGFFFALTYSDWFLKLLGFIF